MKKTKKRIKTPTYILTLKLKTNAYEEAILNKRFEIGRKLYNGETIANVFKRILGSEILTVFK